MFIELFGENPIGRRVVLAQRLFDVTGLPGMECLQLSTDLFLGWYTRANPKTLLVGSPDKILALDEICKECNITLRIIER